MTSCGEISMDSCSECFLPELKKLRLFSKQYRNTRTVDFLKVRLVEAIYSYFEKGCRKKCTRESRKVLWVVWVHRSSNKFERMAREATDVCLRVLKESNNTEKIWHSYSVRNSVLIISHITFRDCRVHIFSDNLSRSSCKSSLIYGRSFCSQNCENISVET